LAVATVSLIAEACVSVTASICRRSSAQRSSLPLGFNRGRPPVAAAHSVPRGNDAASAAEGACASCAVVAGASAPEPFRRLFFVVVCMFALLSLNGRGQSACNAARGLPAGHPGKQQETRRPSSFSIPPSNDTPAVATRLCDRVNRQRSADSSKPPRGNCML
jgi:hypothetical protein